jgi:cytochrome c5
VADKETTSLATFALLLGGMVVFAILLFVGANALSSFASGDDVNPQARELLQARLAPIGQVNTGAEVAPVAAADTQAGGGAAKMSGQQVVTTVCSACHGSGVMNAPKIGSSADWKPRLAQGFDTLVNHASNGFKAMPPKGGNASLSEDEIKEAIHYMLEQSQLKS